MTGRQNDPVRDVVVAGHTGDTATARAGVGHADFRVRRAAIGALERLDLLDTETLAALVADPHASVRARAVEAAAHRPDVSLLAVLDDSDPVVLEMAAWACGEQHESHVDTSTLDTSTADASPDDSADSRGDELIDAVDDTDAVVARLIELAEHAEVPLVRESAIAALGAIGDERSAAVTMAAARTDKPAVRRRAVVALSAYAGDAVIATLRDALDDRDWQVRGAAEDVLRAIGDEPAHDQPGHDQPGEAPAGAQPDQNL